MARAAHGFCWGMLLLCLLLSSGLVSASLPDDNYLFLVHRHRRLSAGENTQPTGPCDDKAAGEPVDGQYMIVFDTAKVSTIAEGVSAVRQSLQAQGIQPTAAPFPVSATQPTSPADPFGVITPLTMVPEEGMVSVSSSSGSSSTSRRRVRRRVRQAQQQGIKSPYLGAVIKLPTGPAEADLVSAINATAAVETIVPDVCIEAKSSQPTFSCLPATMLSSSIQQPAASAVWDGCLSSNTYLAWYGERCGTGLNQVLWTGVYAFDKTTGARLANCVKQRPANGGTGDAQVSFWLGACGTAPGALPAVSGRVCQDPFISDTLVPAEQQGCMSHNFTGDAVQTLELFHPVPGCGTSQPVSMTFKGQRCSSNSGSSGSSGSSSIGSAPTIVWQTAEPAPGSGLDASKCSLQRRTGTAAEDLIWNMDWFGSCGVPPARALHMPRSECPAPPPPPPPSPSPRPEDQKALDREDLKPGETRTPGMLRIQAIATNGSENAPMQTVRLMDPVSVAVLDTGVDCFHPDLNVIFNKSFVQKDSVEWVVSDANGCADVFNHGTNVAGIVGAKNNGFGVVGVAPNAGIVSLKILNSKGKGTSAAINAAVLWLMSTTDLDGTVDNPGNLTNAQLLRVDVINMSLGYPGNPYASTGRTNCEVLQRAQAAGLISVAAAGNEKEPINTAMPGACGGVIAVVALDQKDGSIDNTQSAALRFTNWLDLSNTNNPPTPFKANLTIAAPGESVWSTCPGQNQYCSKSGTSQATPHVSGMLARCFSGRRCQSGGNGTTTVFYAVNKWQDYNLNREEYGYRQDPIRTPGASKYYGYLTNADVW